MIIICCPKCKLTDIGEEFEEKRCMRCGTRMLSLGITSSEWNKYNHDQMKEAVDNCISENSSDDQSDEKGNPPIQEEPEGRAEAVIPDPVTVHIEEPSYDEGPVTERLEEPLPEQIKSPIPEPVAPARRKSISKTVDGSISNDQSDFTASNTIDNSGKVTKLSIAALICAVLGCTSIIGIILGIVDLIQGAQQRDNRKKGVSIAAIVIGIALIILTFVSIIVSSGLRYVDRVRENSATQESSALAYDPTLAPENMDFTERYKSDTIVAATMALDNFISGYDMSSDLQKWTVVKFDDTDTVMGMTDITYNGKKGKYIYVGTLYMNDSGNVESSKPHYLEVNGEVLGNDGYCDNALDKIRVLEQQK